MVDLLHEVDIESMKDKKFDHLVKVIGDNVLALRLKKVLEGKKGWAQENMIQKGFSYRHYQRTESGVHAPNLYTLHRIAEVFDVEPWELMKEGRFPLPKEADLPGGKRYRGRLKKR